MRSMLLVLFLIGLPVLAQVPVQVPGVEKPKISVDNMVVGQITDTVRGTMLIKNIVVTGGACYNGARPSKYSVKIDQLWGDIVNETTRQTYHLVFLDAEWKNDTTCSVWLGLRGGPLPVPAGAIRGHAQLAIQAYIQCLEKYEAYRIKNIDIEVSN